MRFELSVALKYLVPKRKQLSASIITLMSICVVSLVVWLAVVFLSVSEGIQKRWVEGFTSFSAPLKLVPTEDYYKSYFYQIDGQAMASGFSLVSLKEKRMAGTLDPYDPTFDRQLPTNFPSPLLDRDGTLINLAQEAWDSALSAQPDARALRLSDHNISVCNLKVKVHSHSPGGEESYVSQVCYVSPFDEDNKGLLERLVTPQKEDLLEERATICNEGLFYCPTEESLFSKTFSYSSHEQPQGILVPSTFKQKGVHLGDTGFLSFVAPSATSVQEQKMPVYVSGFFDISTIPFAARYLFVHPKVFEATSANLTHVDDLFAEGINVWYTNLKKTPEIKRSIQNSLKERGVADYWKVVSYEEFDYVRPILAQFETEKTLFTLIMVIILTVASTNIISMLILLVNDKKREIGILQSLGATKLSIATIFGFCGLITGLVSSLLGATLAILTVRNLSHITSLLTRIQGREFFQPAFYGGELPSYLSVSVLIFTLVATVILSILAALVPALKAARVQPAATLRREQ